MKTRSFETDLGDTGLRTGAPPPPERLQAFWARYRFADRTWGLVIWAASWEDACQYAQAHGLTVDGKIVATRD